MEKNEIKILRLFGPSVMVAKIPSKTLDALNNYIDVVVEDKKKSSDLDYGNQLVGDVHFSAVKNKVKAITPVPGGVGPMTIACLLSNTLECFKAR